MFWKSAIVVWRKFLKFSLSQYKQQSWVGMVSPYVGSLGPYVWVTGRSFPFLQLITEGLCLRSGAGAFLQRNILVGHSYGVLSPRCIIQQKVFKQSKDCRVKLWGRGMLEWTLGETLMLRVEPIFSLIICNFLDPPWLCCWQMNTKYFVFPFKPQSYTMIFVSS